jgi:hypothetical protein
MGIGIIEVIVLGLGLLAIGWFVLTVVWNWMQKRDE